MNNGIPMQQQSLGELMVSRSNSPILPAASLIHYASEVTLTEDHLVMLSGNNHHQDDHDTSRVHMTYVRTYVRTSNMCISVDTMYISKYIYTI